MAEEQQMQRKTGWFGPIVVTLASCILTVTILGSIAFLGYRVYEKRRREQRVATFMASLQNRSPDELAAEVAQLREQPGVKRYLLPEIQKKIAMAPSEQQRWSAIRIAGAFIDSKAIEKSLFELRKAPEERLAAEATRILSEVEPPKHAAELLGQCIEDAQCAAVVDEACAGLFRLGVPGQEEIRGRLTDLSEGRRIWLVRFAATQKSPASRDWLEMLAQDDLPRVSAAAREAIARSEKDTFADSMG